MKIQELRERASEIRGRITELYQISEKSKDDFQNLRELKTDLAVVEDMIAAHNSKVEKIRAKSNISKRFSTRTFDNFDKSENVQAWESCKKYVDEEMYNKTRNSLMICGAYGTGKTHLAASIANALMDEGVSVLYNTYTGHLEKLKAEYDTPGTRNYLELMKSVDVLILDDVGKEKQTEWSESIMFEIINSRYENMLPVIITSNFATNELEGYFGKACYSRLVEMCSGIVTQGRDMRRSGSSRRETHNERSVNETDE